MKLTQNEIKTPNCFIDIENAKRNKKNKMKYLFHYFKTCCNKAWSYGYESFLNLLTLPALHHLTSFFSTMKSFVKGKRCEPRFGSQSMVNHDSMHTLQSSTVEVYITASNDGRSIVVLSPTIGSRSGEIFPLICDHSPQATL